MPKLAGFAGKEVIRILQKSFGFYLFRKKAVMLN